MSGAAHFLASRSPAVSGRAENRRIETSAPSSASGCMMALTRLPSGSRALTIGLASSILLPTRPAIRWTIFSK